MRHRETRHTNHEFSHRKIEFKRSCCDTQSDEQMQVGGPLR